MLLSLMVQDACWQRHARDYVTHLTLDFFDLELNPFDTIMVGFCGLFGEFKKLLARALQRPGQADMESLGCIVYACLVGLFRESGT